MMKIKEGDKVKFLNDIGGGVVTKIIDTETALVLNDTGFEIPVMINELLPETREEFTKQQNVIIINETESQFEKEPIYTESSEVNFYLAYVPKDQGRLGESDCDIYLINDSNYFVYYNFARKTGSKYESITGKIEPNVKEKISDHELSFSEDSLDIAVQLLFFCKEKYALKEPVSTYIKVKSGRFYKSGSYKENDFFDEFVMLFTITKSSLMSEVIENIDPGDIKKVLSEKEKSNQINKPKSFQKKQDKNIKEVDLHIHELIDDESGMSDNDKLQHQLDVFHREMKSAISENYRRIVFIHGVGSGSLKLKLRSELQHKYKHLQFQDASFKEYGYGATMVLLRK